MRPLRVVRIIARLNVGGPAVHLVGLAGSLDAEEFPSALIIGESGANEGDMRYLAEEAGLDPIIVPTLGRELSPLRDLRTVVRLVSLLRKLRPDIVETHTAKAGAVGRLAAWLAGVPVIVHVFHGHVFHSYFGAWKTRLFIAIERFLARRSTAIVTISERQRHDIVETYRIAPADKVRVIPIGLDLAPFRAAAARLESEKAAREMSVRKELGLLEQSRIVSFVGRLTDVKNPLLALEVAKRVLEQSSDTAFLFVGDGELRSALEEEVKRLGELADRILFLGWRKDMPRLMASSDVVLLTSKNEGTPVSLIEALAARTPVVASNVGGVADVVRDGEFGLLGAEDEGELTAHVLWMLANPEGASAMAARGQQHVMAEFSRSRLLHAMAMLYHELADRAANR